jgi:hypothetical protein
MSRGLGKVELHFLGLIMDASRAEPMTFAQMIEKVLAEQGHNIPFSIWRKDYPTIARSFRRAIASLVDKGYIVAVGRGGPLAPHRYCLHPEFAHAGDLSDEARMMISMKALDYRIGAMSLELPPEPVGHQLVSVSEERAA